MNQMQDVAIGISEKHQAVTLIIVRFSEELYAMLLELGMRGIEIIHLNCQMPDARIFHLLRGSRALRWDDFEHAPVGRFDEIIAIVREIDDEAEMVDVPVGELLRIWRSDRRVFQSFEHIRGL